MNNIGKKKGMTLIELMVAMAIFSIVLVIAVGAFIQMNNLRALAMNARESQQKLRMAIEVMSRYSRQADRVIIADKQGDQYKEMRLFFNIKDPDSANWYAVKFKFEGSPITLNEYQCKPVTSTAEDCTVAGWGNPQDLLGGELELLSEADGGVNGFRKNEPVSFRDPTTMEITDEDIVIPTSMYLRMSGVIGQNSANLFYKNDFDIQTRIILENVK